MKREWVEFPRARAGELFSFLLEEQDFKCSRCIKIREHTTFQTLQTKVYGLLVNHMTS